MAVAPFVLEATTMMLSSAHGRPLSWSATPPQRSTTFSPWWYTLQAAPTSPLCSKFAAKVSWTRSKPGPLRRVPDSFSAFSCPAGSLTPARRHPCYGGP